MELYNKTTNYNTLLRKKNFIARIIYATLIFNAIVSMVIMSVTSDGNVKNVFGIIGYSSLITSLPILYFAISYDIKNKL